MMLHSAVRDFAQIWQHIAARVEAALAEEKLPARPEHRATSPSSARRSCRGSGHGRKAAAHLAVGARHALQRQVYITRAARTSQIAQGDRDFAHQLCIRVIRHWKSGRGALRALRGSSPSTSRCRRTRRFAREGYETAVFYPKTTAFWSDAI